MLAALIVGDQSRIPNLLDKNIYGRREFEDIRDSTKFELYIYIYMYIYIYIFIYIYVIFLTYLYSYSITTLYHSVVSKNLFVFSMFDCL